MGKIRTQEELAHAMAETFSTEHGKAVLTHLIETYCVPGTHDRLFPNDIYYNEGRRSVVMDIIISIAGYNKTLVSEAFSEAFTVDTEERSDE